MGNKPSPKPMQCEEADEDGAVIPGAEVHYARSIPPSPTVSPTKERPNTGRSRRESKRRESAVPVDFGLSDSDSTAHPSSSKRNSKMKSKEDRKSSSAGKPRNVVVRDRERERDRDRDSKERDTVKRPPVRSSKTTPLPTSRASDEAAYYGVAHQKTIAASRPRSHTRPLSYHGRPPLSGSAYYPTHPAPPQAYPPPPAFSPPSWIPPPGPMAIPGPPPMGPMHPQPPQLPPPSPDFNHDFNRGSARDLSSRFERPQSAMGFRQPSHDYDHEPPHPSHDRTVARRSSVSRKASKHHEDRVRMPPPPRPSSALPSERRVLRPPPPSGMRKSVGFEDDDLDDDDESDQEFYEPLSRRASVEYGAGVLQARSRRDSHSLSDDSYDDVERYQLEPASYTSRRNSSYNLEDKMRNASRYQSDVTGPAAPLTAETLRRVKDGDSRGSTRSSGSHDESDYKHSATTRTTRSASGEDDLTIKLPEGAVVEINGARITCPGGGDVNIGRNNGASRVGSDRATSIYEDDRKSRYEDDRKSRYEDDRRSRYEEDRKSRHERLPLRTRASSQAAYTRSMSHAPPLYPHGYSQYPGYNSSYYDTDDPYY
ncbi:hypothetical protein DL769_010997 [Monosporascus sp. CRB-8-3]|nr:hypothetical protein DL769_010997 [Monosporascus sp. CRB-8-3]